MATASYKDSWDAIERKLKKYGNSISLSVESAIKIKSVLESAKNTKRLVFATRMLAVFTIILAFATLLYAGIGYKAYLSLQEQTEALKALTQAVVELPKQK